MGRGGEEEEEREEEGNGQVGYTGKIGTQRRYKITKREKGK